MVGVFPHCRIRRHPAAPAGGYLPLWSVLCWVVTTPAQAGLGSYCGKSRQPSKATCPRKREITRFKQLFLHKLSFEAHSSVLNSVSVHPRATGVAAQYQSCHTTGSAISCCFLYTYTTHGLDVEAFPMETGEVPNMEGQRCACICW